MNQFAILIAGLIVGGLLGFLLAEFKQAALPRTMAFYRDAVESGIMSIPEVRKRLRIENPELLDDSTDKDKD